MSNGAAWRVGDERNLEANGNQKSSYRLMAFFTTGPLRRMIVHQFQKLELVLGGLDQIYSETLGKHGVLGELLMLQHREATVSVLISETGLCFR